LPPFEANAVADATFPEVNANVPVVEGKVTVVALPGSAEGAETVIWFVSAVVPSHTNIVVPEDTVPSTNAAPEVKGPTADISPVSDVRTALPPTCRAPVDIFIVLSPKVIAGSVPLEALKVHTTLLPEPHVDVPISVESKDTVPVPVSISSPVPTDRLVKSAASGTSSSAVQYSALPLTSMPRV
jgi:hypothetical protein